MFELWFVEFTPFELSLSHEPLGFDPLSIVVGTFSSIFKVHESFEGDDPSPLFVAIAGAEVKHIFEGPDFESCGDHVFLLAQVAFIGFDFSEIDILCEFFEIATGEDEDIVHGEDHPAFPPLLEEFGPFIDGSFSDFVAFQLAFNYFRVHNISQKVYAVYLTPSEDIASQGYSYIFENGIFLLLIENLVNPSRQRLWISSNSHNNIQIF